MDMQKKKYKTLMVNNLLLKRKSEYFELMAVVVLMVGLSSKDKNVKHRIPGPIEWLFKIFKFDWID